MWHVARTFALMLCGAALTAAGERSFEGLQLEEALRLLQRAGLPIVFSSEVVKPEMRVSPSRQIEISMQR